MRANQEQHYRYREQELLGRGVLVPIVNLLPHVEVVVGARVEVEWYTAYVVEHEVGSGHVREVDQGPGCLLGHARDDVKEDLAEQDEHQMDCPRACVAMSVDIPRQSRRRMMQSLKTGIDMFHVRAVSRTFCVYPFRVQVGEGRLVAQLLERLGRLLVDKTTATAPSRLLCIERHGGTDRRVQLAGPRVASEAQAGGTVEEYG